MWTVEAEPERPKARRQPYTPTDLRDDPGLDRAAAAAHGARRHRDQLHRRATRSSTTSRPTRASSLALRALVPRRVRRARRATTPTPAAATSSTRASSTWSAPPGWCETIDGHRRASWSDARRRADPRARRRRGRDRQRAAHRRRDRERRGGRDRHRDHADRREQPHGRRSASPRRWRRCNRALPRGRAARRRSTTAPTWSTRRSRPSAEPARRRGAGRSRCCSCCSATSARR